MAEAWRLFDEGTSIEAVATAIGRVRSTVAGYLEEYIGARKPESVAVWVRPEVYARVETAAHKIGGNLLRPVFESLNEEVSYDEIRLVMRHAGLR
jgi:ATP-dependent DNA helicase RecQ